MLVDPELNIHIVSFVIKKKLSPDKNDFQKQPFGTSEINDNNNNNNNNSITHFPSDLYDVYHFRYILIDESDINFRKIFQTTWESISLKDHSSDKPTLLLIGSCGSPNACDLGQFYIVETAYKFDRGELREDRVFVSRKKKILKKSHSLDIYTLERLEKSVSSSGLKKILTTNFINQCTISDDKKYQDCLLDMETWDFYDVASFLKEKKIISGFSSVRFVTDLASKPSFTKLKKGEILQELEKMEEDIEISNLYAALYGLIDHKQILKETKGYLNGNFNGENSSSLQKKNIRLTSNYKFDFIFNFLLPCRNNQCGYRNVIDQLPESFNHFHSSYKRVFDKKISDEGLTPMKNMDEPQEKPHQKIEGTSSGSIEEEVIKSDDGLTLMKNMDGSREKPHQKIEGTSSGSIGEEVIKKKI